MKSEEVCRWSPRNGPAAPAISLVVAIIAFTARVHVSAAEPITVSSELKRMRSSDHLFRPQSHRLIQYSGFHRRGGNPDRMYCLYEEDGWRVVADHRGPGVVSRIWTTHRPQWGDVQVEVDGKVIFSGKANRFFEQARLPFVRPLSEIRNNVSGRVTAEKEASGKKEWAVSYVPIPFERRFRYLQRDKVYANINIKSFSAGRDVESFLHADWDKLRAEFDKTADVWRRMDLYGACHEKYKRRHKTCAIPAAELGGRATANVAELAGPGIIRSILVRLEDAEYNRDVDLQICWDDEEGPGILSPLDHGFGSREHRTLAIGQAAGGWRVCYLPMPFREKATIALVSRATKALNCEIELFVEDDAALPPDVLYLRSYKNDGKFAKGAEFEKPDLPLEKFFYHNGYTAFEHRGAGHIVAYMDLFDCQPELDEHVFIDDERTFPDNTWNGTGHEDLFDMAWGHSPVSAPMTSGGSERFEEVNVKLFWNDPMTFRKAIRFNWEWAFRFGIKAPRNARFASVVYWYGKP